MPKVGERADKSDIDSEAGIERKPTPTPTPEPDAAKELNKNTNELNRSQKKQFPELEY